MKRGTRKSFPAYSDDPQEPGWYEVPDDREYVCYWNGTEWDTSSYEKGLNWWMGLLSFFLWWGPWAAIGYGVVDKSKWFIVIGLVVLLVLWVLYVAWRLLLPIRKAIWQTFRCMAPGVFGN